MLRIFSFNHIFTPGLHDRLIDMFKTKYSSMWFHCDIKSVSLKKKGANELLGAHPSGMCIEFEQQVVEFGSGFFSNDVRAAHPPQLSQGCHGETSWFSEDFLHESMAIIDKRPMGDLLKVLADVRQ